MDGMKNPETKMILISIVCATNQQSNKNLSSTELQGVQCWRFRLSSSRTNKEKRRYMPAFLFV